MHCESKHAISIGRFAKALVLAGITLLLGACAATQVGVPSGAKTRYETIAVVPRINDRLLTVYRRSEFAEPILSEAGTRWNATRDAGQISIEFLGRTGASVSVTSDPRSASAKAAQAVIVLQQTPLDQFGLDYSPERNLFVSIAVAAVIAEATGVYHFDVVDHDRQYRPRTIFEITGAEGEGPNHCAVGVTPSLVNAATGETLRQGRSLMGVERLPVRLSGVIWQQLSATERSTVLAYCQSALRRVVSQSFVELDIVE